jgi:HD-like signal output (HDOD) protein
VKSFKEIAAALDDLPTLPVVVSRVLEVVEDSGSSARDLVEIIQTDQAMAAKVIRVANSPYYGLRRRVTSISHAVVLLGFDTVRNLCLGVGVLRSFATAGVAGPLDLEGFWRHTVAVGMSARLLWQDIQTEACEEMFLAGLIHDMGRLAFLAIDPRDYALMMRRAQHSDTPMYEVEKAAFGGTHAELGALLCDRWGFGPILTMPVRHHHEIDGCPAEHAQGAAGISLCDTLARRLEIGWTVDASAPKLEQKTFARLSMTREDADGFARRIDSMRPEIDEMTLALM